MPNIIPPLLSSTPPPIVDDDEEDEFGDFRAGVELPYDCDGLSLPPTPEHDQKYKVSEEPFEVNGSKEERINADDIGLEKDFQDRRKNSLNYTNKGLENMAEVTEEKEEENEFGFVNGDSHLKYDSESFKGVTETTEACDFKKPPETSVVYENLDVCSDKLEKKEDLDSLLFCNGSTTNEVTEQNTAEKVEDLPESSHLKIVETIDNHIEIETAKDTQEISTENAKPKQDEIGSHVVNDLGFDAFQNTDLTSINVQITDTPATFNTEPAVDDDFGDFENHFKTVPDNSDNLNEEDQDDFGGFESHLEAGFASLSTKDGLKISENELEISESNRDDIDDFDDFASFSAAPTVEENKDIGEKAEAVIKSSFPLITVETEDWKAEIAEKDLLFEAVKDIMETNALKFHWVNSGSQKTLLKALNIDMRNILYGPGWNLNVPKFAANLGLVPLEPLKPEILIPEAVTSKASQQNEPVASFPSEVPSAQFDWTSAGLTNPLDYSQTMLLLDIEQFVASLEMSSSNPTFQESQSPWDVWVETTHGDENQPNTNINLDWTFLEPSPATSSWTPKEATASPAHSLNLEVNPDTFSLKSDGDLEEVNGEADRKEILTNMVPLRETHICEETPKEEDEFEDFQMSLPAKKEEFDEFHGVKPFEVPLEPLKPVVVHQNVAPVTIQWPEPGLTQEDINSIELTYIKQNQLIEKGKVEEVKKQSDDDDWTDFISHTESKTSPEKVPNGLQLSVFNLSQIQPVKPPVPVITPQGLVQTKLSSSGTTSPMLGSPIHAQRPLQKHFPARPPDSYRPSIISQQYSKQLSNNTVHTNNTFSFNNYALHPSSFNHSDNDWRPNRDDKQSSTDDDDWTDFISGQPPPIQTVERQSWSLAANPSRYDALKEFRVNGDVGKKVMQKSSVPSVVLPELDFVVAKNRTFAKK